MSVEPHEIETHRQRYLVAHVNGDEVARVELLGTGAGIAVTAEAVTIPVGSTLSMEVVTDPPEETL